MLPVLAGLLARMFDLKHKELKVFLHSVFISGYQAFAGVGGRYPFMYLTYKNHDVSLCAIFLIHL